MKILMRNVGMTLHVIHKLRAEGITCSVMPTLRMRDRKSTRLNSSH